MTDPGPAPAYDERLSLSWWFWPPLLLVAVLLSAELHMGHPGVQAWLPYLVTVPLAVAALLWFGRVRVRVDGVGDAESEIRVGVAHMPVRFVGRADVVTGEEKQRAMGPELDPQAFLLHRPWIRPIVRLEVLDPDDPTPYWVVSTRHPERLLAALESVRPANR